MKKREKRATAKVDAAVLMSGGIDSLACAHLLLSQRFKVRAIFIDFGQAARAQEQRAVRLLTKKLQIPLQIHAYRASKNFGVGEILGRNAFFAFSVMMFGGVKSGVLAMGIHGGTPYYDCSPMFLSRLNALVGEYTDGGLRVVAPFLEMQKADIVAYARAKRLSIRETYSCEAGGRNPCGQCLSCLDRASLKC